PALQSILLVEDETVRIESAAEMPLLINGRLETDAILRDQDRIKIGPFEMLVHLPQSTAVQSHVGPVSSTETPDLEGEGSEDVGLLTPAELVERIEAATELVNDYEQRQRLGIEAMLDAAARRRDESHADRSTGPLLPMASAETRPESPLVDLEALVV